MYTLKTSQWYQTNPISPPFNTMHSRFNYVTQAVPPFTVMWFLQTSPINIKIVLVISQKLFSLISFNTYIEHFLIL